MNEEDESEFVVLADNLKVFLAEIGTEEAMFGIGTVDGSPAVGIRGNLFLDGGLRGRAIKVDEIGTEHLKVGAASAYEVYQALFGRGERVSTNSITLVDIPGFRIEINIPANETYTVLASKQ